MPPESAAGPRGLRLEAGSGSRSIPRDWIRSGIVIPAPRPRVQLRLRHGRVLDVEVPSEQEGTRLLAALGFGPDKRRVAVALGTPNRQLAAGCLGLPMLMTLWFTLLMRIPAGAIDKQWLIGAWLLLSLLSAWVLRRAARPTQVVVGADGVRIDRPFSARWIPYAPRGAEALERRGRDLAAWREDLRKLLAARDYRATSLTPEDAIAALEDADAPRDRRVGAALALRIAEHPEARERIRFAADTSADEELRAALERAAEDEVDAIDEEALGRVIR